MHLSRAFLVVSVMLARSTRLFGGGNFSTTRFGELSLEIKPDLYKPIAPCFVAVQCKKHTQRHT